MFTNCLSYSHIQQYQASKVYTVRTCYHISTNNFCSIAKWKEVITFANELLPLSHSTLSLCYVCELMISLSESFN